ncbi:serine/threonine-protein phosphatase 7 long form homolog [Apium graveolens]|uniref:serine/threonine-protein phosphatase 7 long form homolog n=1 Tax=Apium graveolens TaxID=4045 RepID=UPI003D7A48B5
MLILGLAEWWCADTNTFMFPWGEVTIILEDVIYLGCFSVLGASFTTPLDDEFIDTFKCLKIDHKNVRLRHRRNVSCSSWMEYFMRNGSALEHEAFLALWLSRFVLVRPQNYIGIKDFHVAIHLSRGMRIALAPVVLACIYRDMRLLQNSVAEFMKLESIVGLRFISCHYDLVQMWVWERFKELRPVPNDLGRGEPWSLRWNGVTNLKVDDVRSALVSPGLSFLWRPYVIISSNSVLTNLYKDAEQWVVVDSDAVESFARCLRAAE